MVIVPNSKVKLIKNPLKLDSNNEIMFDSATAQYNYFTSLPKLEFDNLTYVRKDDVLRIPTDETGVGTTFEKLLQYNFCMYQNTAFGNKWFYAFIDDIKWINPSLTELHLRTAYYQSWQFDLVFKDSFIEREHVNDDTIGVHTIPEDVETGDYIQQNISGLSAIDNFPNYLTTYYFVVALSDWPYQTATPPNNYYNGLFSGFRYLCFNNKNHLYNFIVDIQDESTGDPISSIFVVPKFITGLESSEFGVLVTGKSWQAAWVPESAHAISMVDNIRLADVHIIGNNYTPKNNKLLCYPYRCIVVNNNAGSSSEYRYEWFFNKSTLSNYQCCEFRIKGVISPGCGIKIYPLDYNETATKTSNPLNYNYSIDGGKLPTCSWWNDGYTNWLTQNAVNMPLQALGSVFDIAKGVTGNLGSGTSGLSGIAGQVGQIYSHSLEPNTGKGGVNQGDLNCADNIGYNAYRMSIRDEYAKCIDDFFTQFGYKVNRLGQPHLHVRTYFDFIKTIDVNIEGDIPEHDLEEIRKMFNNGIRFWHNTTYYLNFSVNNTIIS